jgi:Bacteriophage minor capsid protein
VTIETYLVDLATHLQTNGYGTLGVDIAITGHHDFSGNAISLTQYGGRERTSLINGVINPYNPDVQFCIRNSNAETAYKTATGIYKLFRNVANQDIGTTHFLLITPKAPPIFLLKTNEGYYEYTINFMALIQ